MINKWNQLIEHLKINENKITEDEIQKLQNWCFDNISEEINFSGNRDEQYQALKKYSSHYFETIGSHLFDGLTCKHNSLKNMSIIQYAAFQGYDQFLKKELDVIKNTKNIVNDVTESGMSPLHLAALKGHKKTSEVLLNYGADISLRSKLKQTPLYLSLTVLTNSTETVKNKKLLIFNILKQLNPSLINIEDISGTSIAHLAAQNGFTEVINSLIQEDPGLVKQIDNFHRSTLHTAIINKRLETAMALTKIQELLIITDQDGRTPAHYAAKYGTASLLKSCLRDNIDKPDLYSTTPLHFAAQAGNTEAVIFLIEKGASVTKSDVRGFTALHYAVESGNFELVEWLVNHTGININQVDQLGRTALINLLVNNQSFNTNDEKIITLLIEKGSDLLTSDKSGASVKDYVIKLKDSNLRINQLINKKITEQCELTRQNYSLK